MPKNSTPELLKATDYVGPAGTMSFIIGIGVGLMALTISKGAIGYEAIFGFGGGLGFAGAVGAYGYMKYQNYRSQQDNNYLSREPSASEEKGQQDLEYESKNIVNHLNLDYKHSKKNDNYENYELQKQDQHPSKAKPSAIVNTKDLSSVAITQRIPDGKSRE